MDILSELIGKKVTVHSQLGGAEKQDIGILERADSQWLKLHKSAGEVLYFTVYQVRLIKPFDS